MKRVKLLLVSFLLLGLTGCFSMKTDLNINQDKSVNFKYNMSIDMSGMEELEPSDDELGNGYDTSIDDNIDSDFGQDIPQISSEIFESKGYKVETVEENKISNVTITKKFANIDTITSKTEGKFDFSNWLDTAEDSNMFYVKGKQYSANWEYDLSGDEDVDYSMLASMFDITYTVTLPQASISNNATTVSDDGKTLTWTLKYGEVNNVQYTFSFGNDMGIYYIIGGAALFLIIIIALIITIIKGGKKNNKASNGQNNGFPEPVYNPNMPVIDPTIEQFSGQTVEPVVDENIAYYQQQPVSETQPTFVQPMPQTQPVSEPQPTFVQPMAQPQNNTVSIEQLMSQQPIDNNQNNA